MNEFKGTPAPWMAGNWLDSEFSVMVDGPLLTRVCRMEYVVRRKPNKEMEANAALISAAPELLEVLTTLFKMGEVYASAIELDYGPGVGREMNFKEWAVKAREAIRKALGEYE